VIGILNKIEYKKIVSLNVHLRNYTLFYKFCIDFITQVLRLTLLLNFVLQWAGQPRILYHFRFYSYEDVDIVKLLKKFDV
jgi:hypothetical protein